MLKIYTLLYSFIVLILCTANIKAQNNALHFDGVDDYVSFTNSIGDDFTIEFWMNTTMTGGTGSNWFNGNAIIDADVAGVANDFGISLVGSKVAFGAVNFGNTIFSTSNVNTGQWVHIAVTRLKSTGLSKIYVNGVEEASQIIGNTSTLNASSVIQIGKSVPDPSYFRGIIDEVRIWNVVRTASEIQSNRFQVLSASVPNLVVYFGFNQGVAGGNNAGLTTLIDATTPAYNGTLLNFSLTGVSSNWVPGNASIISSNNALHFDGTNDYVVVPDNNNLDFTTQYTIEFWFRLQSYGHSTFVSKFDDDSDNRGYMINMGESGGSDKFCVVQDNTGTWTNNIRWNTGFTPALNTWYHVAVTFDEALAANELKLYVNGSLYSQTSWAYSVFANAANMYIGGYDNPGNGLNGGANGRFLNGTMDEVRIWNTARTQVQIQNSFNQNLTGTEPGLVAYYTFNQGIADGTNTGLTTLLGVTSPPNNGTLTGFALTGATSNWVSGVTSLVGNNALQFNGNGFTGPFVSVSTNSNDFNFSNAFTLEAWINPLDLGNGNYTIFSKGPSNGGIDNSYIFQVQSGTLRFYNSAASAAPYWYNSGITIPYGVWSHVAVTYANSLLGFFSTVIW